MSRNKYPEETVSRILEVSLRLFMEKGYENTSIQDIIDGLGGLTKGAIYHHFKGKDDIMLAVIDRLYASHDAGWRKLTSADCKLNGLEKLRELYRISLDHPGQMEMFSTAPNLLNSPKMLALQVHGIFEESVPHYVLPIIEQGIADGSICTDYPKQLAEVLQLLINMWLTPMVYFAEPEEMAKRARLSRQMMLGLGLDLLDEEMMERLDALCRVYSEKKNKHK